MKPRFLFHGSVRKIKGDKLLPRKPEDLENNPENLHRAVYATNTKSIAVAMAIISCKGVNYAGLKFHKKPFGIIYKGWPKQKFVYLYTLSSKTFIQEGGSGNQWYSTKSVEPTKVERLKIADYLSLVRKSTLAEKRKFFRKHKIIL